MRFASWLRRHPLDALVVALAAAQQLEAWVRLGPGRKPRRQRRHGAVDAAAAAAPPVPVRGARVRLRRADRVLVPRSRGLRRRGHRASRSCSSPSGWPGRTTSARRRSPSPRSGSPRSRWSSARDVRIDTDEAITAMVACGVVALIAFVLERRGRRSAALEERAARLAHDREARARAAVAAERARIGRELARRRRPGPRGDDRAGADGPRAPRRGSGARPRADRRARGDRTPGARPSCAACSASCTLRRASRCSPRSRGWRTSTPSSERARAAGLPVALTVEGPPAALAPGVDLAAYRIVQDALDRRARARPARRRAGRRPLRARRARRSRSPTTAATVADGLVGLRERVALYGGEVEAGRQAGGDYAVRVRLPLEAGAP